MYIYLTSFSLTKNFLNIPFAVNTTKFSTKPVETAGIAPLNNANIPSCLTVCNAQLIGFLNKLLFVCNLVLITSKGKPTYVLYYISINYLI